MERWLPVVGWEDRYEISSMGRLRNTETGDIKTGFVTSKGYRTYTMYPVDQSKKPMTRKAHRMVLEAFDRMPFPGEVTLHGPGGSLDNCWPENIRWGTVAENNAEVNAKRRIPRNELEKYFAGVSPVDYSIFYSH